MRRKHHVFGLSCIIAMLSLLGSNCGPPDIAVRKPVIEKTLTDSFQAFELATGPDIRVSPEFLAFLRKAEAAGLVQLRHESWMQRDVMEIIATPKLESIALNPDTIWTQRDSERFLGGEAGEKQNFTAHVRHNRAVVADIITDEKYDGPLATPGEKHRLVLGTFRNNPNDVAVALGFATRTDGEPLQSFRCVMKHSAFNKSWSVVAIDIGTIQPESWATSRVR